MQNYNKQQQAVILKGIAQQILSMNMPSIEEVSKLFKQFDIDFEGTQLYPKLYKAVQVAVDIDSGFKKQINKDSSQVAYSIVHFAMLPENDSERKIKDALYKYYLDNTSFI